MAEGGSGNFSCVFRFSADGADRFFRFVLCAGCFFKVSIILKDVVIRYGDYFTLFGYRVANNTLFVSGITLFLAGCSLNG